AQIETSSKWLIQKLNLNGHFQATARDSVAVLSENEARVQFVVTPGPRFRVRDVALTAKAKEEIGDLPHRLVLDEFDFDKGEIYDPKRISDGRDDLIGLDLFRRVAIEPEAVSGDTLDLKIDVARLSSRSTAIGIGYGSEDKLRGQARWLERDFLGGGRRLEIKGQASFIEQELSAAVTQPRIFHSRSDLTVRGFLSNETEDNYELVRFGGGLGVQRPLTRDLHLRVSVDHEENRLTVIVPDEALPEEGPSVLTDLKTFLTFDSSNDRLIPNRGTRAFLALDGATDQIWSDYTYGAAAIGVTRYKSINPDLVFAGVVRGGVALPAGATSDLPVWRRFYGGGSTDMRSYARRTLGPLDSEGNGVGGETLLEFGAEFRQRVRGPLGVALFAEAGQVWLKVGEVSLADLDFGAGAGLRLATPVGPFRVDVGWKLTDFDPQLNPIVGHFSIGEAF
ncbi:MAG TPA: BamA/TamA family outer membrane protein, partial [Candidatus Udaeobacter sp.]|nr:BamA/TamA family outer membrane protein [Candidatus Udaeobacter sp.]